MLYRPPHAAGYPWQSITTNEHERQVMIETQQRAGANASPLLSFVTWVARTLGATHTPGAPRRDYIDLQLSVMRRR